MHGTSMRLLLAHAGSVQKASLHRRSNVSQLLLTLSAMVRVPTCPQGGVQLAQIRTSRHSGGEQILRGSDGHYSAGHSLLHFIN